ncbi:hypothetical protein N0V88_006516 [Collariella sp. IMI 366227]|nr:hypothetical protein N0V88_006516 [Collariella sp. IMI 366227]
MSNEYAPPPGPPPPPVSSGLHDYAPPPGPPPSQRPLGNTGGDFAPPLGPPPSHAAAARNDYMPPPGPPPSHGAHAGNDFTLPPGPPPSYPAGNDFAPPPGPPPSHRPQEDLNYTQPPPGPPPSHRAHDDMSYMAPPPGPPPPASQPKPQHDWETVVPDTSLFPPPPSFFSGWDYSPAHNATEQEADAGDAWCAQHPLSAPITLDGHAIAALNSHNPRLMQPSNFRGTLTCTGPGLWAGRTDSAPAYPSHNPRPGDICLSLGFTALPYPSFRMPGWHRGSLAIHGDDGHRYVNDAYGHL